MEAPNISRTCPGVTRARTIHVGQPGFTPPDRAVTPVRISGILSQRPSDRSTVLLGAPVYGGGVIEAIPYPGQE